MNLRRRLAGAARRVARWAGRFLDAGELVPGGSAADVTEEEPDVAGGVIQEVLTTLAEELDGRRLTVWRVDRAADRVTAEWTLGSLPASGRAAGNPMTWAVEEQSAMRVDPAPAWAEGDVVVAPIDERRVLSVETAPGRAPAPDTLAPGARILAAVLRLADREMDARAERERLRRVMEFLQGLTRKQEPERVPENLARAAIDLMGARGAVVASWTGEGGVLLVTAGDGGGPEPGRELRTGQGDLAHAARAGATVHRGPDDMARRPPLADDAEVWPRTVPYRVAVPLVGPDGETGGVVAAWGERRPAEQGVRLLEALGPLLSLQLRQASDLVRFRDRATIDALTALPNRAAFDERMADEQARFHRYRRPVALMVIDLDRFKHVNDTHGHAAGDAVLRAVAARVREAVRDADIPARYGGEELAVLMPETMIRAARDVAERVRAAIADGDVRHEGVSIPVTASIGVSGCPERVDEPRRLFDSADRALYAAKEAGRDRVVVAEREA